MVTACGPFVGDWQRHMTPARTVQVGTKLLFYLPSRLHNDSCVSMEKEWKSNLLCKHTKAPVRQAARKQTGTWVRMDGPSITPQPLSSANCK
ncbi:unnamed protein product [Pleuronectes platessa]|uniref:Uncharacterized protein n=1 Tax=Pleuronectes platessa TaxID=8262 RepID=A0A9N7TJR8_PLEPL|nr:unnamed protein product [Pleuronectes platessa]